MAGIMMFVYLSSFIFRILAAAPDLNLFELGYETAAELELDSNLCAEGEEAIFSFQTADYKKTVSLITSESGGYILCRIGTVDALELEFPRERENSWEQFTYSGYFRGFGKMNLGLDLDYVSFETEGRSYCLFDEYSAEFDSEYFAVRIIDNASGDEEYLEAAQGSVLGGLGGLEFDDRIKK